MSNSQVDVPGISGRPMSGPAADAGPPRLAREPFLFIVGSGRSGTSLLRAMFDSHPRMAIPGESYFIIEMSPSRYEGPHGFATDRFLTDLLPRDRFIRWNLPGELVGSALSASPPSDFADAIRAVYACYTSYHGKDRYGDKTPGYVRHIPILKDLVPEARFIHIIRDGRDVAASHVEMEWGCRLIGEATYKWKKDVTRGRDAGKALGPDRYREVRYEYLVADPEAVIRPLCEFADLDFDSRMLRYFERAEEIVAPTHYPHRHDGIFRPPTPGLRDWRCSMAKVHVALVEAVAGDLLEDLGYELSGLRLRVEPSRRRGISGQEPGQAEPPIHVGRCLP